MCGIGDRLDVWHRYIPAPFCAVLEIPTEYGATAFARKRMVIVVAANENWATANEVGTQAFDSMKVKRAGIAHLGMSIIARDG